MKSGIFKYIFVIFVIILIIVTCVKFLNSKEEVSEESLDQTSKSTVIQTDLRLAIAEFDTLNPILSNNKNVQEISKIIYEPLVTLDSELKIQNCLAKEIAKKDDNTYIIKLKENIFWQDGNKFTAQDVQFTIDTIKNLKSLGVSSRYESNLEAVVHLDVIDNYTLSISLDRRVPFFEYYLTFPIMSKSYFENEDFLNSSKTGMAIGTGAFSIDSIDNNIIKLIRNDDYWNKDKIPMVKEVYINLYNNIGDVYEDFKNGNLDVLNVSTIDVDKYIGTLGHTKVEYKTRFYDFISFNTQSTVFSDSQVRKALSLVVDKSAMVVASLGPGYTASNFSLDMGSFLYSDMLNVATNTDLAKQILINDGWEYKNNSWSKLVGGKVQTLNFNLIVNNNHDLRKSVAQNLKDQFANFGIQVNIQEVDSNRYIDILNTKNYDVIIAGLECGYSPNLETFFGDNNLANYTNEEIKNILVEVSNTTDENTLKEKYKRIYEIYLEEAPYFGLYRETDYLIYNQSLVGSLKPNVFNIYQNIEKWYRQ